MKKAVILATASPTHRSQMTYNRTHAMLPALGKPMFIRVMERLYRIGIRDYVVVVGENEGAVVSYLNTHWMPDVNINLMVRLNTDSMTTVFNKVVQSERDPFLVCSYNVFTHPNFPERLIKLHQNAPNSLVLTGAPSTLSRAAPVAYALVDDNKTVKQIVQRQHQPDNRAVMLADFYLIGDAMLAFMAAPLGPDDQPAQRFSDLVSAFVESGGETQLAHTNWILQVEADRDLLALNKLLLDESNDAHILSELPYTVKIVPPVRIDPQVSVGQGATIGPHVYLERGSSVGRDAVIKNSLVLEQSNVPAQKTLVNAILTTRGPIA